MVAREVPRDERRVAPEPETQHQGGRQRQGPAQRSFREDAKPWHPTHARLEARGQLGSRERDEPRAQLPLLRRLRTARRTRLEMRGDLGRDGLGQLAVHEARDPLGVAAHSRPPRREGRAQQRAPAVDSRHHGSDRHAERLRDLRVAQLLQVAQDDGRAEALGQRRERALQVLVPRRERVLRRRDGRELRAGLGQLDRSGPSLAAAEGIGAHALQDRDEPGSRIAAGLKAVDRPVRAQERLLHQVLGVVGVAGHSVRGREQGPQLGQELRLEALVAVHNVRAAHLPFQGDRRPASLHSRRADSATAGGAYHCAWPRAPGC